MSGHSKWAKIKHKKGADDAKKGAAFSKMAKEITAIAKAGGGNLDNNVSLRNALVRAKGINMPKDKIENAIKKGTGELPGVVYEEISFDAYGPGGVAMLITGLSDNKNRSTSEIKNILSKKGANLAGAGATSFLFAKKGVVIVDKDKIGEDALMEIVLDAGADDIDSEGSSHEITCAVENLEKIKSALDAKKVPVVTAEMTMLPSSYVKITGGDAKAMLDLMEALEENEDVQHVYANFDIPEEELERLAAAA